MARTGGPIILRLWEMEVPRLLNCQSDHDLYRCGRRIRRARSGSHAGTLGSEILLIGGTPRISDFQLYQRCSDALYSKAPFTTNLIVPAIWHGIGALYSMVERCTVSDRPMKPEKNLVN